MKFSIMFENRSPFTLQRGEPQQGKPIEWVKDDVAPYDSFLMDLELGESGDGSSVKIPFQVAGQDVVTTITAAAIAATKHDPGPGQKIPMKVEVTATLSHDKKNIVMICDALEYNGHLENETGPFQVPHWVVYFYSPGAKKYSNSNLDIVWGDFKRVRSTYISRYFNDFVPTLNKPAGIDAKIDDQGLLEIRLSSPHKFIRESMQISYFNRLDADRFQGATVKNELIHDHHPIPRNGIEALTKYIGPDLLYQVHLTDADGKTESFSFMLVRAASKILELRLQNKDEIHKHIRTGNSYVHDAVAVQVLKSGKPADSGVPVHCTLDHGTTDLHFTEWRSTVETDGNGLALIAIDGSARSVGQATINLMAIDDTEAAASASFTRVIFKNQLLEASRSSRDITIGQGPTRLFVTCYEFPGTHRVPDITVNFKIDSGATGLKLSSYSVKTDADGRAVVYAEGATAPGKAKVTFSADGVENTPGLDVINIEVAPKA